MSGLSALLLLGSSEPLLQLLLGPSSVSKQMRQVLGSHSPPLSISLLCCLLQLTAAAAAVGVRDTRCWSSGASSSDATDIL